MTSLPIRDPGPDQRAQAKVRCEHDGMKRDTTASWGANAAAAPVVQQSSNSRALRAASSETVDMRLRR
jgi:hypothetical protein